jgi:hypothetical protein
VVPWRGLEPPQDYSYTPLKRARLPIPPPRHVVIFTYEKSSEGQKYNGVYGAIN